jgi:hypothetical protein
MILRLTTVHENPRSAGILPAAAGHRALDDVGGRMPVLPFSWERRICISLRPEEKRAESGTAARQGTTNSYRWRWWVWS